MIIDFRHATECAGFDSDICIVGAGAAGLALAREVAGPLRILVVEAGDRRPPRGVDDFLIGEAADFAFDGFVSGRRRAFGGATRAWFGQCIRLDPIDFEKRDWVPHSGWPIAAAELDSFYDRAEAMLGIGKPVYDARIWQQENVDVAGFDNQELMPKFTIYCPQPDFTKAFGRRFFQTRRDVTIMLNAAVVRIELDPSGRSVTGLLVRGEGGRERRLRARAFVLCGGAIENPRLLLASHDVQKQGIGNANDLVGRFFQDHPSATTGVLATSRPRAVQLQFRKIRHRGLKVWPKLALTDAAQRRGGFLNANALMLYEYDDGSALTRAKALVAALQDRNPRAAAASGWRVLAHLPELACRGAHLLATGRAPIFTPSRVLLKAHVEQVPDPGNRVTLSHQTDRFGVPRARVAWRMHADEIATMRGITEAAGRQLHRLGFGTMSVAPWLDGGVEASRDEVEDSYHHAGTTRMAATPAEGVVDTDCRVFGIDNLYVAGGSVFPTSGYANPTLTIVAMAIRLSDKLRQLTAVR
jgi:choline dehydrogenase-like flavoprotein